MTFECAKCHKIEELTHEELLLRNIFSEDCCDTCSEYAKENNMANVTMPHAG